MFLKRKSWNTLNLKRTMKTKNQKIKNSLLATKEKRKTQSCKVFELKIVNNQLNQTQIEFLNRIFLEAK